MSNYSFVTSKNDRKTIQLLQTPAAASINSGSSTNSDGSVIKFKVLETSLSANNKFYLDFGEKPPFSFFKCYPVMEGSQLVDDNTKKDDDVKEYVHPAVWGICEVIESNNIKDAPVGSVYRAMLPMGTSVEFEKAEREPTLDNLIIHRPTTFAAYNSFSPIPTDSVCHPNQSKTCGISLTCFPGIITGFGLYFTIAKHAEYYSKKCNSVVITSASSKVALALALYLKHNNSTKTIIGYTSNSNKKFCESTNLYDKILGYDDTLPSDCQDVVMVDISGNGSLYKNNKKKVVKLLVIGNSSGASDKESTFATFSMYATVKMVLTMMGNGWLRSMMNPKQEIFLIFDIMNVLLKEWGKEKYAQTIEEYTKLFCDTAMHQWDMTMRLCDTEETIQKAFEDIVEGNVPPIEYIILNTSKAVEHRC